MPPAQHEMFFLTACCTSEVRSDGAIREKHLVWMLSNPINHPVDYLTGFTG